MLGFAAYELTQKWFRKPALLFPQTSVALGVLAVLVEDQIPDTGQNLCAGTGLCTSVASRGLQGASYHHHHLPPPTVVAAAAAAVCPGPARRAAGQAGPGHTTAAAAAAIEHLFVHILMYIYICMYI